MTAPSSEPVVQEKTEEKRVEYREEEAGVVDDSEFHFSARSPEERKKIERRVVRKLDLRLLPILIIMYFFNFVDRSNLANARLGGLEKDLKMTGTDFNLATSILFIGYIIMQLPSNLLITMIRPSLYLGCVMTVWGLITTLTSQADTFKHLLVIRFFLGVIEAPFFPSAMFVMSSWYTRAELGQRYAFFYAGSALANMFNGLMSAGILSGLDGARGIAGWRWLFIIQGSLTIFFAMLSAALLPDYPRTTRWLSREEQAFAEWRLAQDVAGAVDSADAVPLLTALRMALTDYRAYLFVVMQHCNLLSQAFTYFFPTIVGSLGYNSTQTLLLTAPPWFAAFLASVFVTWHAARTNVRSVHIVVCMLLVVIGNIVMITTPISSVGPRYFAMFLLTCGALPAFQVILTWVSNSFPRPFAKRSAVIALVNMLGNIASTYGSFLYPASEGPRYVKGGAVMAAVAVACAGMAVVIRVVLARENGRLERMERGEKGERGEEAGLEANVAGVRNVNGFRFIL
ncbi:major facilitator superfamily domain-containing protein [Schizophyllum commune]